MIASSLALTAPIVSLAQTINNTFSASDEVNLQVTPRYPIPNQTVTASLSYFGGDLDSANITWYQNGKSVLSGKGEKTYSFKVGNAGTETKIEVDISLLDGASLSKSLTLIPASVDLVWEANSYTPPFYKGKALHPRQGSLKIVAMPEFVRSGQRLSSKNLVYEWSNGIDVYQDQSGYGKNTILINGSLLGQRENIRVVVTDPVSGLAAESYLTIEPTNPKIIFYENDPYYGHIFDQAIANPFSLETDEVQVVASPYYLSKEINGSISYVWTLNGATVPNLTGSRSAVFRKPEGEGRSILSLRVENGSRVLQQTESGLEINFKK